MPTGANVHVIAVDATDFTIILSDFSSLVHDKLSFVFIPMMVVF